jgi:hypothetical protein
MHIHRRSLLFRTKSEQKITGKRDALWNLLPSNWIQSSALEAPLEQAARLGHPPQHQPRLQVHPYNPRRHHLRCIRRKGFGNCYLAPV